MRYDKLVRDLIPEYITNRGGKPKWRIAEDGEYWVRLKDKLLEEVNEFLEAENEEEVADVLEVIEAIIEHKGFEKDKISEIKYKKLLERGAFRKKIILEES